MNDFDGGENNFGEGEENNVGAYVEVDLEEVDEHPARGISPGGACGGAGEQETDLGGNVLNVDGFEGAAEELESSAVEPESHDVRPLHDEEPSAVESPAALHAADLHEDTPYDFDTGMPLCHCERSVIVMTVQKEAPKLAGIFSCAATLGGSAISSLGTLRSMHRRCAIGGVGSRWQSVTVGGIAPSS